MANIRDIRSIMRPVRRGQDIREIASASRINAIQDAITYILDGKWITVGTGMRRSYGAGGVHLNLNRQMPLRGGGGDYSVWNYVISGDDQNPSITFRDGLVNNILPSNSLQPVSLSNGMNYIFARATANGSTVQSVTLVKDSTMQAGELLERESVPPVTIPVFIATALVQNGSVSVQRLRYRNVICTPIETRREGKKPQEAGMEAFTRYYAWRVDDAP